ncbi:hypothetical protein N3K66_003094 [Trichothecium roseum]|uniref:Uncharacterized protein n=1 Tax=Trichothecium roseum TaxID=47278 RepID=A0ACC0V672_9HYPO|nr:hypothetical protein N3K66_003094 [Trichothecium roseum]
MAPQARRPAVQLPQGKVLGVTIGDGDPAQQQHRLPRPVEAFYAIPYALPPTGDRRFRPAVPVPVPPAGAPDDDNATVLDATGYGPSAPGKPLLPIDGPALEYSEDCLTANVFRHVPDENNNNNNNSGSNSEGGGGGARKGLLPVAVYVHGGAFNRGTASMHDTASMVSWSAEPFVAVSFNYRLGALGFLPCSAAARAGALNLGLRDQVLLLEWVRDNIARFGGDPGCVTLFGLSAGAHSIGHLIMYHEQGQPPLFHRAILESGAPTSRAVRPYDAPVHEQQFRDFLAACGLPADLPTPEVLPALRSLPLSVVGEAQTATFDRYNPSLRWAFQPCIDGDLVARPPLETWLSGRWHRVPIMTGFARNEGSLYVDKACSTPEQFLGFFRALLPLLPEADIRAIDALYPDPEKYPDASPSPYRETREGVGAQYARVEAAYANYAYQAPVRQTAELASSAPASAPVYLYQWALETSVLEGARHGDNMRYEACEARVLDISPAQAALAKTLHAYVVSFIVTGDPNALVPAAEEEKRPTWGRYERGRPRAMVFGEENKELVGGEAGSKVCEFVDDDWSRGQSEFWWSKVGVSQK